MGFGWLGKWIHTGKSGPEWPGEKWNSQFSKLEKFAIDSAGGKTYCYKILTESVYLIHEQRSTFYQSGPST